MGLDEAVNPRVDEMWDDLGSKPFNKDSSGLFLFSNGLGASHGYDYIFVGAWCDDDFLRTQSHRPRVCCENLAQCIGSGMKTTFPRALALT